MLIINTLHSAFNHNGVIIWVKPKLKRRAVKAGQAAEQAKKAGIAGRLVPIKRRALSLIQVKARNSRAMQILKMRNLNNSNVRDDYYMDLFRSFFCGKGAELRG